MNRKWTSAIRSWEIPAYRVKWKIIEAGRMSLQWSRDGEDALKSGGNRMFLYSLTLALPRGRGDGFAIGDVK